MPILDGGPDSGPESPCNGVCRLDAGGACIGCGRHMREIMEWPGASALRRHEIVAAARERLSTMRSRPEPQP